MPNEIIFDFCFQKFVRLNFDLKLPKEEQKLFSFEKFRHHNLNFVPDFRKLVLKFASNFLPEDEFSRKT